MDGKSTDSVYPILKFARNAFLAIQSGPLADVPEAEDTAADAAGERKAE
jgi:hypothetical protein